MRLSCEGRAGEHREIFRLPKTAGAGSDRARNASSWGGNPVHPRKDGLSVLERYGESREGWRRQSTPPFRRHRECRAGKLILA
ncbi:hypothetical protein BJY01DRAFT_220144 [Aspergillus pseudoustus]|uniref:Uncharacterized protein n=1 Tax=Aspergillus pseudoustus TaxID=1810923 RepID=A0ABR4JDW4_9EURO